jgi:cyclohexanecarboxylate-CoA ligase
VRLPVPEAVRDHWRAAGAWTDETLLDRLTAMPDRLADRELIVDHDIRVTGRELAALAARVAGALHAAGVEPGAVVVYQLPNWWESAALAWGILLAGAVASPLTPTLRHAEVAFVLEQTGARLAVVPRAFRGFDHAAMLTDLGFDGTTWITRSGELDAILTDERRPPVSPVAPTAADAALVLWTSGTTSQPKGVVHTHQSLRHEADSLGNAHAFTERDRQLLPMPMTHVAGFTYGVLMPVCLGVPAVLMDVWDPGVALRTVTAERISVMISTPVFVRSMIDHPDFAATDTSSVRLLSLGGAGVAPATVREGATSFGANGCWCKRTYGSTEYPTLTTGRLGDDPEIQAVTDGVIIGPAELRIVDPVTLVDRPDGQPGELWARGPEMFNGYLDPALDAAAFAADGWFRTGDLATYAGGYLTIVDRLKDIVIRGGENISAAEVEHALLSHPAVADCAVVAVPDPVMGERTCAFVIARGDEPPSLADLAAHVAAQGLAPFKRPERLEVRATLPRTPSGKVQKGPLRDEVARLAAAERGF